ncbi:MAG: ribulose-phosphate 3-epimerase [Alphaproteobacteria bacterium]|nr:ribulose-phosphate 3-epimerase [Alphaproteobacteria bacterium]
MILSVTTLSADFANLGQEVTNITQAGADWIHMDCFDGHFVPTLTFGPDMIKALRPYTDLPFDIHYMAKNPEQYVEATANAGANRMTVHFEACANPSKILDQIRASGMAAGLALMVNTPAEAIKPFLSQLDQILVMTVRGGFGGDPFREDMVPKIQQLREWIDAMPTDKKPLLAVDGGVSEKTIGLLAQAGADVFCSGSGVLGKPRDPSKYAVNIQNLRKKAASPI